MATDSGHPPASSQTKVPYVVIDSLKRYSARKIALLNWFKGTADTLGDPSFPPKPSVKELVTLAGRIVQATRPKISVPRSILDNLKRTIDLRKRCNAWYEECENVNPTLRASNERHRHFYTKLEEILSILRQARVDEPQKPKDEKLENEVGSQNLYSALESLDLEEEEHLLESTQPDAPSKSLPSATLRSSSPTPTFTDELEDPDGGLRFAVSCLQVDLQAVRQFLGERLACFQRGEITLMRLSLIINAAIWSARRLEMDILEAFPAFTSWEQVVEATLPDIVCIEGELFKVLEPSQMRALGESFILPLHRLKEFRSCVFNHELLLNHALTPVPLLRHSDQEPDVRDIWRHDTIILDELFCEVAMLRHDEHLPIQAELVRGLKEAFESRVINLWVVFGLQVFLDTQHLLGKDVIRGFRELESMGSTCICIHARQMAVAQVKLRKKFSSYEKKRGYETFSPVKEWIQEDKFASARHLKGIKQRARPFYFLTHDPITCGLFQSALLLKLQVVSLNTANVTGHLAAIAHIYHAAKNEDLLIETWRDLEEVMDIHGSDGLFLGEPPSHSWQYLTSYVLMLGISAQYFAKRLSNKMVPSARGRRLLKFPALLKSFEKLLCQNDPPSAIANIRSIEELLHMVHREIRTQSQEQRKLWNPWATLESLDNVQMLSFLEELIAAEEPGLRFDYQALNEQCFLLLATIEMNIGGRFATWVADAMGLDTNVNNYLHFLPSFIFTRDRDNNILSMVGRTIDDFIRRRCQVPNGRVNVVLNDEGWEGLEDEHPTHHGDCLHWGRCARHTDQSEQSDSSPTQAGGAEFE